MTTNGPDSSASSNSSIISRRDLLKTAGLLGAAGIFLGRGTTAFASNLVDLPFANGERSLARFPQKSDLILLRTRPPLLETPFDRFDKGVFTSNEDFYVRWHLPAIPTSIDVSTYKLRIDGHIKRPIELSLGDVLNRFNPVQMAAVNQCSGNSRGFFAPRVPGGQWGNGAMGNALWRGVALKEILNHAGIQPGAVQVRFGGLDEGEMPQTPHFLKSLDIEHAMNGEVMIAYEMNGAPLPMLNGFPLRLVVPGWYATYWVKMLSHIEVLDRPDTNYWMKTAYLIPDTPGANMHPGQKNVTMVPINRMVPRSFITNLRNGAVVPLRQRTIVRGIAFGGDTGLGSVMFSSDGGQHWSSATMGPDRGKYGFRQWEFAFDPASPGEFTLMAKAINSDGVAQPLAPNWNPGGFMRNVVESVRVRAAGA